MIAILQGIIFAVSHVGGTDETTTESTTNSTTATVVSTSAGSTQSTRESTTASTTTTTTTTTTTKPTTTTTTKPTTTEAENCLVTVDVDGNGSVTGEGVYSVGKKATLVATADAGSTFVGWYNNGVLVASGNKYTVTVMEDLNLTARFQATEESTVE